MRQKFPVKKISVLIAILALPGFLYYLLQEKGKNRYHPLEIFGPKKLSGTFHTRRGKKVPDTTYHRISLFPLTTVNGSSLYLVRDTFSVKVVCFYFKGAAGETVVNQGMKRLADEYTDNPRLRFYSITGNAGSVPDADLARQYNAPAKHWTFLATGIPEVQQIAGRDFLVDAVADLAGRKQPVVSPMLILLDPMSHIRGFYDSGSNAQLSKLSDEIKVLIAEELRKIKGAG